ncbi:MAG: hypothetical protein EG825_14420 [Rhodocyclaceae bacterium]|nr:hypothetical protein [Rhodocyclaceae bacterium]
MCTDTGRLLGDRQAGFAIASAIFLLVILAGLGAFMITLSGNQQLGLAQDVNGSRALLAARAGLDWGACMMVKSRDGTNYCGTGTATAPVAAFYTACSGAAGTSTLDHAAGAFPGLAEFTVSVTCTKTCVDEGTACPTGSSNLYLITATACNSPTAGACPNTTTPGPLYVERQVTTLVEQN